MGGNPCAVSLMGKERVIEPRKIVDWQLLTAQPLGMAPRELLERC